MPVNECNTVKHLSIQTACPSYSKSHKSRQRSDNNNNTTEVLYSAITHTKSANALRFTIAIKKTSNTIDLFQVCVYITQ